MRKNIALIVMCIGILLIGCSNQENPSDNRLENNTKPSADITATAEPTAPADETAAPVETVAPTEPAKTDEPTTEPTEVPTVEPTVAPTTEPTVAPTKQPTKEPAVTKTPTKAPVVTKAPTKKPVVTKTPTKAPATKQPTTTKNPNAAGKPYKVGNVTVTPVKGVTMWSKNQGLIRTKPWTTNSLNWGDYGFDWKKVTEKNSVILGHQYFSEIEVTGICSNGFIQYYIDDGEYKGKVYTHKDQLFTEKPKEFYFKGYDPKEVIKMAHKKLKKKGFTLMTDYNEEMIAAFDRDIKELEADLKAMEDGTYDYSEALGVNRWTKEEEEEVYKETKSYLEASIEEKEKYIQYWTIDVHKHKPIKDPYEELGSFQGVFANQNLNRLHIDICIGFYEDGMDTPEDIANALVSQYELNVEMGNAFQNDCWIYYGEGKMSGEKVYWFYLT